MAVVNSFATFFEAVYPAEANVLDTAPTYGDAINVLNGTNPGGGGGGPYPTESDVRQGIGYDDPLRTGTLVVPAATDVRNGINYDVAPNAKVGSVVIPAATDVRETVNYDVAPQAKVGSVVIPADTDVRETVNYDVAPQAKTGKVVIPTQNDVIEAVNYDVAPNAKTGKWRPANSLFVRSDQLFGVNDGLTAGQWVIADAAKYQLGETYGSPGNIETGSYDPISDAVFPAQDDVLDTVLAYGPTGAEFAGNWNAALVTEVIDTAFYGVGGLTQGTYDTGGGAVPNYPDQSEVLLGVMFGTTGSEEFSGNVRLPGVDDVINPVAFGPSDGSTGNYHTPTNTAVLTTETYGVGNATSGGWTAAQAAQVVDTYSYGDMAGTPTVGTLNVDASANLPAENKVLRGTPNYGSASDKVPDFYDVVATDVKDGINYGEGNVRLGTYDPISDAVFPAQNDVLDTVLAYGPTGAEFSGNWHAALVTEVIDTAFYGVGGLTQGTYDTGGGAVPNYPDPSEVIDGVIFGTFEAEEYVGEWRKATAANVLDTHQYGLAASPTTGSWAAAEDAFVESSHSYGVAGSLTPGRWVKADPGFVLNTHDYGTDGISESGAYDPGVAPTVPDPEDVRFGIPVGQAGSGVLELPTPPQVLLGVGYGSYGTEYDGQLICDGSGGTSPTLPPVLPSGQLRTPLIVGDAYMGDRAFVWVTDKPDGWAVVGSTVTFSGHDECNCDAIPAWEKTGVITEAGDAWTLTVELTSAETTLIVAGEYAWTLKLDDGTDARTVEFGIVEWIC